MAASAYAKSLIGGLSADIRQALSKVFEFILDGNLRFGAVEHQQRAENFAGLFLTSTTASVTNTEFSIAHGLVNTPRVIIPVIDPGSVGSQMVTLTVSRAADSKRIYFKAASTSAVFTVYAE